MKNLFGLLALFIGGVSQAQISTNIYWTTKTDLPSAETIYYSKSKKLNWQDFTAQPVMTGNVGAITSSGFGYKASLKKLAIKGN